MYEGATGQDFGKLCAPAWIHQSECLSGVYLLRFYYEFSMLIYICCCTSSWADKLGLCLTFTAYSDNTTLHESDGVMNHGTQCNTYLMNRLVFHCAIVMQRAYRGLDARHRVGGITMQGSLHSSTPHHRPPRLAINRFHSYTSRKATAVSGSTVGTDEKLPPEVRRG